MQEYIEGTRLDHYLEAKFAKPPAEFLGIDEAGEWFNIARLLASALNPIERVAGGAFDVTAGGTFYRAWDVIGTGGDYVPTRRGAARSRRRAMVERYESLPVRGFFEGTFSISTVRRPNSPWIVTRWTFLVRPGTA